MSVGKEHFCQKCGKPRSQSLRHDTYYCAHCNVWLEPKCSDKDCVYCKERPEEPDRPDSHQADVIKGRWLHEKPNRKPQR